MKKVFLIFAVFFFSLAVFAKAERAENFVEAGAPAECNLPVEAAAVKSAPQAPAEAQKTLTPAEQKKNEAYMPSDKAKVLMAKNEEVKKLVKDFSLDIK